MELLSLAASWSLELLWILDLGAYPLPFHNLLARCLQDATLPLGQALNPLSRDLIQNRIHFLGQEFLSRQVLLRLASPPSGRCAGTDLHQPTWRLASRATKARQVPIPMNRISDEHHARQHAPKVRRVSNSITRPQQSKKRQSTTEQEQILRSHGNDKEQQKHSLGK